MIAEALEKFRQIVNAGESKRPATIDVQFPAEHPLAGIVVGSYVATANGGYEWKSNPALEPRHKVAETRREIVLHDVAGAQRLLKENRVPSVGKKAAFVSFARLNEPVTTKWFLDNVATEKGWAQLNLSAHPQALAWSSFSSSKALTHSQLSNFLLDHQEELAQPMVAKQLAVLRHARKVEWSADLDTGSEQGVKATFDAKSANNVAIPRELVANVIPWAGLWPADETPQTVKILVRIRLVPPTGDDATPHFSLVWANEAEFTAEAVSIMCDELDAKLGEDLVVMRGSMSVNRVNVVS